MNLKKSKTSLAKKLSAAGLSCAMVFTGTSNLILGTNLVTYAQDPADEIVLTSQDVQDLMQDPKIFFQGTNGMTFKIPDGVTEIGNEAFCNCHNISEVIIPDSVTKIGWIAFFNCSGLERVYIPDSVTEIAGSAFSECRRLSEINIPDSVTKFGVCVFQNCTSLKRVRIPSRINRTELATFSGCVSLTEIEIPNNIAEIGDKTFLFCEKLKKVKFLETENSDITNLPNFAIGENSFTYSGIKHINGVPGHTVNVGPRAFEDCNNFNSIEILGENISLGENFINRCNNFQIANFPNAEEIQVGNTGSSNPNVTLLFPPTCKVINKNS